MQLSLLGRTLLYKGAEEIYRCSLREKEMKYTKYNKPYFEDEIIKFNISHSDQIVVCALSNEYEVGIDIEMIADFDFDIFKCQMTENEQLAVKQSDSPKDAFFDYWAQKEAVIKAHGSGLAVPLKSFEILDHMTQIDHQNFYLKEVKIDKKYKCYVSLKTNIGEIYLKEQTIKNLIF